MKILIINNNSSQFDNLVRFVTSEGHSVESLHWDDPAILERYNSFDVTIFSGGSGLAVRDHRDDLFQEIKIAKETTKPLIGICLGFQIIVDTYGAEMERNEEKTKGLINVEVLNQDDIFKNMKEFEAFVSHKWHVRNVQDPLIILAKSGETIEAVRHKTKPIYGFQFHPESAFEGNMGAEILRNLLKQIESELAVNE